MGRFQLFFISYPGSENDVFASRYSGTILHYGGVTWNSMTSGTSSDLLGVWGSSSDDIFAVGYTGSYPNEQTIILHYDGNMSVTWTEMTVPSLGNANDWLHDVWGTSSSDVYAVGWRGWWSGTEPDAAMILHFDGTNWEIEYALEHPTAGTIALYGVWGSSSSNVYAVGSSGTVLHYEGPENNPPVADAGGPYTGNEGSPITLDASASSDPDGTIVLYEWDWDNNGTYDESTTLTNIEHTWYDNFTSTIVGLRVTDSGGTRDIDTADVAVNNAIPEVTINAPADGSLYTIGATVSLQVSFTNPGTADTHECNQPILSKPYL